MNLALVIFGCLAPAAVPLLILLHDWWAEQPAGLTEEFDFLVLDKATAKAWDEYSKRKEWP